MLRPVKLDKSSYLLYASKHYTNTTCYDIQEFKDDLSRIIYVRRLLLRYRKTNEIKERLALNHIIIVCNVFGVIPSCRMFFFKLADFHSELKTLLDFLGILPDIIENIDGVDIDTRSISTNYELKGILNGI